MNESKPGADAYLLTRLTGIIMCMGNNVHIKVGFSVSADPMSAVAPAYSARVKKDCAVTLLIGAARHCVVHEYLIRCEFRLKRRLENYRKQRMVSDASKIVILLLLLFIYLPCTFVN